MKRYLLSVVLLAAACGKTQLPEAPEVSKLNGVYGPIPCSFNQSATDGAGVNIYTTGYIAFDGAGYGLNSVHLSTNTDCSSPSVFLSIPFRYRFLLNGTVVEMDQTVDANAGAPIVYIPMTISGESISAVMNPQFFAIPTDLTGLTYTTIQKVE